MVKCKLCEYEYNALGIHLRRIHNISVGEYLEQFPGSPTISEESRKNYGDIGRKNWKDPEIRKSMMESMRPNWDSEENKRRLREHNRDPKFIESQRERLSILATNTNKRMWKEDYETCRERATKNALWAARKSCVTKIQLIVADYLKENNIKYTLEKYFTFSGRRTRVDIYLDDLNLVVEINGLYWHGKPGTPIEEMSDYQREGYERDRFKESVFGNKLLFLWEDEIYSGEFKSKLDEFITIGHVKLGELLET